MINVIDALVAESVIAREGGVSVVCGPVIFDVQTSSRDSDSLEAGDMPCPVYCRMETSDDQISLVGFSHPARRDLYLMLRTVKGIGRRSALMILDCGEVTDTLRAVAGQDEDYFSGIPGLGQKRIAAVLAALGKGYTSLPNPLPLPVAVWVEARDALSARGVVDAETVLMEAIASSSETPKTAQDLLALTQR